MVLMDVSTANRNRITTMPTYLIQNSSHSVNSKETLAIEITVDKSNAKDSFVRSTRIPLPSLSPKKKDGLEVFRFHYRKEVVYSVDAVWAYYDLDRLAKDDFFEPIRVPSHINRETIPSLEGSQLGGRMIDRARSHATGMVQAVVEEINSLLRSRKKKNMKAGKPFTAHKRLEFLRKKITKPYVPEVIAIRTDESTAELQIANNVSFPLVLVIKAVFAGGSDLAKSLNGNRIAIPLQDTDHHRRLRGNASTRTSSALILTDSVDLSYYVKEVPAPRGKGKDRVIAIDQGLHYLITAVDSDGVIYRPVQGNHSYTWHSGSSCEGYEDRIVTDRKHRRKIGSKGRDRATKHEKDYINEMVNKLAGEADFSTVRELRLEDIRNLNKGKNNGKRISKFTFGLLRKKLRSTCEEYGIKFVDSPNAYRSQRCNSCGFVHADNRKETRELRCTLCGYSEDADVNACINHLEKLVKIETGNYPNHTTGFFWKEKSLILDEKLLTKEKERIMLISSEREV